MSPAGPVSRREFAKLAAVSAGAAVFGCSEGILGPEKELVVAFSGSARYFDGSGVVTGTRQLAPAVVSGLLEKGARVLPDRISNGLGKLRVPAPPVLAYARNPEPQPAVSHRTDRAPDGTVIETTFESLLGGIPRRRLVRVPSRQLELVDGFEYNRSGGLSVLQGRILEARIGGRLVVDLRMEGAGEIRVVPGRPLRDLVLGSPFLPQRLEAQDCGARLTLRFIGATLSVIAALGTCVADGPFCLFSVIPALIDWADCLSAIEACDKEM